MKVFLTGATGYIGSVIAEKLIEAGHQVSGLSRSEQSAAKMREKGIEPVAGDLRDAASVAAGAKEADAVIHAGFIHDIDTSNPDEFVKAGQAEQDNVRAILDVLHGTNKVFVVTSGTGVIGDTGEQVFTEETAFEPPPYMAWRSELEKEILAAQSRNIRSVVIRPPMVYGRGGSIFPSVLLDAGKKAGIGRYLGTGENKWSTVHVDDLADLYVLALEKASAGSLLHSTAGEPVSIKSMAESVSRNLGAGDEAQSWSMEDASREIGMFAPAIAANVRVSSDRTKASLNWQPFRPSINEELESGSYAQRL